MKPGEEDLRTSLHWKNKKTRFPEWKVGFVCSCFIWEAHIKGIQPGHHPVKKRNTPLLGT